MLERCCMSVAECLSMAERVLPRQWCHALNREHEMMWSIYVHQAVDSLECAEALDRERLTTAILACHHRMLAYLAWKLSLRPKRQVEKWGFFADGLLSAERGVLLQWRLYWQRHAVELLAGDAQGGR